MELIFLGMNEAGREVYDWLNSREDVEVLAVLTEKTQLDLIERLEPDMVVSSGFEHRVPGDIIEVPEKGIVNLHPSFLPYNRGAYPYIWPIIDKTPAGVSIHFMDEEIDTGDIMARREVPVLPDDTAKSLRERLMSEQAELFKQKWEMIRDDPETVEQEDENATLHTREEFRELRKIDLEDEASFREHIDRLRALTHPPQRNAYFELDGERYFLRLELERDGSIN
jgi:methionyl-tRNA formyltransferase